MPEAVARLHAEGPVETFYGRGSSVLAMPEPTSFTVEASAIRSHADVLAMIGFRLGVESKAAYLAAAHLSASAAEEVRAALEAFPPPDLRRPWRRTSRSTEPSQPPPAAASTST